MSGTNANKFDITLRLVCPLPIFPYTHSDIIPSEDVNKLHQQDNTQLEYWNFWSCWATSPSHPRLQSPLIPAIPANLVFQ